MGRSSRISSEMEIVEATMNEETAMMDEVVNIVELMMNNIVERAMDE